VGAVWLKLVSACISLQTGKITANPFICQPLPTADPCANLQKQSDLSNYFKNIGMRKQGIYSRDQGIALP
jgi:hypothetical protein